MIRSRKLVAAAILTGIALIIAGLLIAPFSATARAAAGSAATSSLAADRIGAAFASLSEMTPDPALFAAAARAAEKGDFAGGSSCAEAVWPNIDASCLRTTDGAPARHVRTITIGYQSGENTTVLVRVPSAEVAKR